MWLESALAVTYDLSGAVAEVLTRRLMRRLEDSLELLLEVLERILGFFECDVAAADQRFGVVLARGSLGVDQLIHLRLSQRGIICLVVASAAVRH